MSMSNELRYILKDLSQYMIWPVYSLLKKAGRSQQTQTVYPIYNCVRKLQRTYKNIELLKSRNIINPEVGVKDIPNQYLGRCYTVAELLRVVQHYLTEGGKI